MGKNSALFFRRNVSINFNLFVIVVLILSGACKESTTDPEPDIFQLLKVSTSQKTLSASSTTQDILTESVFTIEFSAPADTNLVSDNIIFVQSSGSSSVPFSTSYEDDARKIIISPLENLSFNELYTLTITDNLKSALGADFPGIEYSFQTKNEEIELISVSLNGNNLPNSGTTRNVSYDDVTFEFTFSSELNEANINSFFNFSPSVSKTVTLSTDKKTVTLNNAEPLDYYAFHSVFVSTNLTSSNGAAFAGYDATFQTGLNPTSKFPTISDDELLTKVQEQTFKYFWDFAHPVSGLARERNSSGDVVTLGGSGFGVMAILVGIERGFITKAEGIERLRKIVTFLGNADRFHGVWPHWINGSSGDVIAFSAQDNGADLVETAFMAQGLIAARQYLNESISEENEIIADINTLLDAIEWNWFTRDGRDVLYWHWSPNFEWAMNLQIKGYNESLIVYLLASSSKNYSINKDVYTKGWASSGGMRNGKTFYGYSLPVGYDFGGPLFFAHYSFLGLDPRGLSDEYADYWIQNRNHTLINKEHSVVNPNNFMGYSADSWGITASDEPGGYSAHEPTRDNGTLTPTAALSSMPYTPDESMDALRHFYYVLGDKLWGEYGFYDAFNPTQSWWANSFLAIDQGPIIVMIENHRTGLIWDLFMTAPEVQTALDNLDFIITE